MSAIDLPPIYLMSEQLLNVIENKKSHGSDFMMVSDDFNDRCLSWFDNHCGSNLGINLFNLSTVYNRTQLINEATRYTNNSASVLDFILVDKWTFCQTLQFCVNPTLLNLDHCCVYCNLNFKESKTRAFKKRVWDHKATDFNSLNTALSNAWFDSAYAIFDDVDNIVCYTNELILTTWAEFVPNNKGNNKITELRTIL